MFHSREIATLRAALRYWSEEITPHGDEAAQPYLDSKNFTPLSLTEISELIAALDATSLRYVLVDAAGRRCTRPDLIPSEEDAASARGVDARVALVLLPEARKA